MKECLTTRILIFILLSFNLSMMGFIDVIGRFFGSVKKDIVESVVTSKITALKPRLLTFEEKGKLVRFGGVFALIMSLISLLANVIVIIQACIRARKRRLKKGDHSASLLDIIKIPLLLTLLSLSIIGISFSAFWFGEYLIHLPESVREFIIKK